MYVRARALPLIFPYMVGEAAAGDEINRAESLQFDFNTIRVATDNFSDANKLGQGGFGAVYKVITIHIERKRERNSSFLLRKSLF